MKSLGLLVVFVVSLAVSQQSTQPAQLTQVPPKPTCTPLLRNGSCADLWRNYNQALSQHNREEIQLYVNRQKELASQQATAPLQEQIADLNKVNNEQQTRIVAQQQQMQADSVAALQEISNAKREGLQAGAGIGAAAVLILFAIFAVIRRIARNFTITKRI
jgi:hypothetical protein